MEQQQDLECWIFRVWKRKNKATSMSRSHFRAMEYDGHDDVDHNHVDDSNVDSGGTTAAAATVVAICPRH